MFPKTINYGISDKEGQKEDIERPVVEDMSLNNTQIGMGGWCGKVNVTTGLTFSFGYGAAVEKELWHMIKAFNFDH